VAAVSYGHADKLAAITAATPTAGSEKPVPPIDPALYRRDDVLPVLAERNIAALYRVLKDDAKLTQRQIAELTGQSQSEVSEILKGRQVRDVTVLERICDGLGIPRELMGLSYGEPSAYRGEVEVTVSGEVGEDMQRRDVLAAGFLATFGSVPSFVALLDHSAAPDEVPLPSRLGASDVAEIRNSTAQLRTAAQRGGGQARAASVAAAHYRRFTAVPATERCAGLVDARRDRPNHAIKLYQIAGIKLGKQDPDLAAWLDAVSAGALADMGHEQAGDHLTRAQDGWQATDAMERAH